MDATTPAVPDAPVSTSRAINIDASRAHVTAMCAKHDATITAIEDLISGGTRVVLMNGESAARVRAAYGAKVMTGAVVRTRWVRNI